MQWRARAVAAFAAVGAAACATAPPDAPPLEDPAATAERRVGDTGATAPWRVDFTWDYGDASGRLSGDGVARINPPDRFRLDFFTAGEGSMAASLQDGRLATLGQIEDVRLPDPPFLYAMAGLFRPGAGAPARGWRTDGELALVYVENGGERHYRFQEGRLVRVEERQGGRWTRRIELTWGAAEATWPREAEYRDLETPMRVRWRLAESRRVEEPFPGSIYELGG